ncbi:hypothetical protein SUGI_0348040 [Cryptomeria japonica]|uniref:receptor-like protein 43 n=1 Tax=Cryptomeria japonica TaxID=3369 RepID=UPI002408AA58|nr:receptor-like protein 43 [Cryptomeria japonica]GLJ19329.1 hypothetical protein SUGI_0348040 [Cryptomeria japonica]
MERLSVMLCFFIVMTCCFVSATCYVSCLPHERDALLAFKSEYYMDSAAAKQLGSWRGFNCCDWHGVQCSQYSSHVILLRFSKNYFHPFKMLHPAFFQLKYMKHLDLSCNYFTGVLPRGLFSLQKLRYLDLKQNRFEGEIPVEVGSLFNLTYLNLGMNSFQGRVPWQFGNLSHLEFLDVSKLKKHPQLGTLYGVEGMNLHGSSVRWIENLRKLKTLSLGGIVLNVTSRELEAALSHLHHLQRLELLVCQLSGHIPNAIQNLTSLSSLILDSNEFSSIVPSWLGSMPHLQELSLSENPSLSGDIAHILWSEWPQLTKFDLSGTNVTGSIPPCIGNISLLAHPS